MTGRLTTHVLDTARGRPAAGLRVSLYRIEGDGRMLLCEARTNADGRTDVPLLQGAAMMSGVHELVFAAGDYLRANGQTEDDPAFLDLVPIRFAITAAGDSYHVPLLLSPYGYATYRGS